MVIQTPPKIIYLFRILQIHGTNVSKIYFTVLNIYSNPIQSTVLVVVINTHAAHSFTQWRVQNKHMDIRKIITDSSSEYITVQGYTVIDNLLLHLD